LGFNYFGFYASSRKEYVYYYSDSYEAQLHVVKIQDQLCTLLLGMQSCDTVRHDDTFHCFTWLTALDGQCTAVYDISMQ
jgi:hypothetical protein